MTVNVGIWAVGEEKPCRVHRSKVNLESNLEDWIAADPALLAEGLRVVGRQVWLDAGPLDLLAIDAQGRWIVIELKRGRLYREAVAQALDYVACLRAIDAQELIDKLRPNLASFGDPGDLATLLQGQIEDEGEGWEISVMLVGTGVDPGLERVVSYLGEFQLPVSVVTFEVFALPSGEQLLLRDVIEEQVAAPTGSSKAKSLEDVRRQAVTHGVATEFDRVIAAAEAAGLFVRPYVKSVMITPPNHRNRFLMVVTPRSGGRLFTAFGPDAFDEFFGDLTAQDVTDALGDDTDAVLSGEALVARVGAIEAFLAELPIPQAASTDGATANAEAVKAIVSLVEPGEWTTYGDVSTVAISRASAAQTVGNIARTVDDFPNAHRLLNKAGSVPPAWTDGHGGGPEVCRQLLESEGVTFDASGVADVDRRVPLAILRDRYRGSNAVAPSDPVIRN